MQITTIEIGKIKLPQSVESKEYLNDVIEKMADEIKLNGWPKGKELGVKEADNDYEVHASFAWFKAGQMANIEKIPCIIY